VAITVPKVELHAADACNLSCTGCTHYADHGLPAGVLAPQTAAAWLGAWAGRIAPLRFTLLGGEPLLNPDAGVLLGLVRATWPDTRLRLVTNGLLLPRRPELWPVLVATGTILTISVHARAGAYRRRFEPALRLARERAAELGVLLDVRDSVAGWYKLYRGAGPDMRPFADGDPNASWAACQTRHCVTLRDGVLWKCPPLAHLPVVADRHGLGNVPQWQPYLAYRPLPPSAGDDEIRRFIAARAEPACGMCPARPAYFEKSVTGEAAPW
jgi:hypothetical protein